MRESLFETLVGLAVVAVAGFFLFFSLSQRSDASTADAYDLIAKFDRADGVSPGTDVRVAGVKVGTVRSVKLDQQTFKAEAVLAIKKDVQIPEESAAQIQSDSLLGGSYIHIQISGMPENMQPGSKFEYTRGSMDILGILLEAVGGLGGGGNGDAGGGSSEEALP
ncbi:MAG: outer membrane lipid asymmetry maintenance protein MlaD [Burkholderiales bacterium]|nr:MAG: outer membrane lipid asymmetry maintenance protein MlaD [Burkholderiales bacterium]